ncbi:MAG: DUF4870 domain-containing protein [Candidatus Nanoarchaeia archaeon]
MADKTSLGLDENIEGLLCYALTWLTGIVFLVVEKKSDFVKFHAAQSIVVFLPLSILGIIFSLIPFGWLFSALLTILVLILWLILMLKAYQGERYKLPIAGDFAEKLLKK